MTVALGVPGKINQHIKQIIAYQCSRLLKLKTVDASKREPPGKRLGQLIVSATVMVSVNNWALTRVQRTKRTNQRVEHASHRMAVKICRHKPDP